MPIRIRILDPHWKKMDPDPGHFLTDLLIFFNKKQFQIFCLILILKLDEPFRNEDIFIISLFSKVQIWGFGVKKIFFLHFLVDILPLGSGSVDPHIFADPDPWIHIFLRIRIQEAKIFRILILSTALNIFDSKLVNLKNY